jgi:alkanesulfonate monooxygenase SsuD/methylene tetrahydromethanopterin reductase-like flavin-dependent oxidoreductase (luciferase family)
VQLLRVTDDRRSAAEQLLAEWGPPVPLSVEDTLEAPFLLLGTPDEIAAQLVDRQARFGVDTWTVFAGRPMDPSLEDIAAVVSALGR